MLKSDRTIVGQIRAFCLNVAERGSAVFYEDDDKQTNTYNVVSPIKNKNRAAGILLSDVVNIDLTRAVPRWDEVQVGGLVDIATKNSLLMVKIPRHIGQLPIGQTLYFHKGKYTIKQYGTPVAVTVSKVDRDSFVKIMVL